MEVLERRRPGGVLRSRTFWKIYIGYALLLIVVASALAVIGAAQLEGDLREVMQQDAYRQALLLQELARPSTTPAGPPSQSRITRLGRDLGLRLTLIDAEGRVIADSHSDPLEMDNHSDRPEVALARDWRPGDGPPESMTRRSETLDQTMAYLALPILEGSSLRGFVRVSQPLESVQARVEQLRWFVGTGALVAILLGLGLGVLVARWLSAPLITVAGLVVSFVQEDEEDWDFEGGDEILTLTRAFKRLSRRLKKRMRTLVRRRQELAAIFDGMVEGIIAVDREERIVHMNDVAGRLLQTNASQSLGRKVWEQVRVPEIIETVTRVLETGDKERVEMRLTARSKELVIDVSAAPFEAEDHAQIVIAGAVLVLHDVTRLRQLEAMRRDFMANVSHELKTPLTAIRGLIETVLDDPEMPPKLRTKFLGRADAQTERLARLVSDLLHLSRVESEEGGLKRDWIDVREPIAEVVGRLASLAETKGVKLALDAPDEELTVEADDEALQQLAGNLLSNAIHYSPRGGTVTARLRREEGSCLLEVADEGLGIPVHEQERIFERFYRVDKARSRELGGTGLGLSIVKHITRALDGEVSVESSPGRGSTFRVKLPLLAPAIAPST